MTTGIFDRYWQKVAEAIGNTQSRGHAIRLSKQPPPSFNGTAVVEQLYQALDCEDWKSPVGTNWVWRESDDSQYETTSPEVSLEREIVAAAPRGEWTYQLSTASGIDGGRRAIDLVHRTAPNRYAFIELKVGSDNSLYAAFELLSYALAYLHARRNGWQSQGKYDVMDAHAIDLIILAPEDWYIYKDRGGPHHSFDHGWLIKGLNEGLASLSGSTPSIQIFFESFVNKEDAARTAEEIISRSSR